MVTPPAKPGFQFITSINTITRNDETRRRVRSHARRQKLPSQTSAPQPRSPSTQKERITKFRLGTGAGPSTSASGSSRTKRTTAPPTELGSSAIPHDHHGHGHGIDDPPKWETTMISKDLSITVAKELPNFSMLRIETTPLTENLLKYCMTVCLSPQEKFVQKWFARAGAPTYMNTRKANALSGVVGFNSIQNQGADPLPTPADHSSFLASTFAMNPTGDWMSSVSIW